MALGLIEKEDLAPRDATPQESRGDHGPTVWRE
jgi:hypothetical protein